jgi:hypothetical protein
MPCYSAWNAYLEPDTPAYLRAKSIVEAKLLSTKHIVDYYYRAHSLSLPNLPAGTLIDGFRQPRSTRELNVRVMISHHFACDGLDFCTLYDVCTLLNEKVDVDRSYLAVILPCATMMRQDTKRFASHYVGPESDSPDEGEA